MSEQVQCPKCKSTMHEGVVVDRGYGRVDVSSWIEGEPAIGWLGVKMRGKTVLPITTYRCPSCGYLESFARET